MSFDGIKVQHGALDTGASDVLNAATSIRNRLDQLADELKPLSSDWTGSAKMAYEEAKKQWDQAIDSMIILLNDASRGINDSNTEYQNADRRGAGRFGG